MTTRNDTLPAASLAGSGCTGTTWSFTWAAAAAAPNAPVSAFAPALPAAGTTISVELGRTRDERTVDLPVIERRPDVRLAWIRAETQRELRGDGGRERRRADDAEPDVVRLRVVQSADVRGHEQRLHDEDDAERDAQQREPGEPLRPPRPARLGSERPSAASFARPCAAGRRPDGVNCHPPRRGQSVHEPLADRPDRDRRDRRRRRVVHVAPASRARGRVLQRRRQGRRGLRRAHHRLRHPARVCRLSRLPQLRHGARGCASGGDRP